MRTEVVLLSHWLLLTCGIFLTAIQKTCADYGIITLLDQTLSVREDTFWELQKQRIRSEADWISATSDSPGVARDQFQWQLNRWMTRQYAYQLAWGNIDERSLNDSCEEWGPPYRADQPGTLPNVQFGEIRTISSTFQLLKHSRVGLIYFCFRLVGGKWQLKESRFQKKRLINLAF